MKKLLYILTLFPLFGLLAPSAFAANYYVDPMTGTLGANWNPPLWTQVSGQGTYGSDGVLGATQIFKDFGGGASNQIIKFDYHMHADDTVLAVGCRANSTFSNQVWYVLDTGGLTHVDESINGSTSRIGAETSYNNSTGTHHMEFDCVGNSLNQKEDGTTIQSLTDSNTSPSTGVRFYVSSGSNTVSNLQICDSNGCETPAPKINVSPASSSVTVGTPFNVNINVNGDGKVFNAAQATVAVSSNLTVTGFHSPTTNPCNFQYTQTPSTSSPSFAGAIYGTAALSCNVYTLTLTPNASGTGTITLTNGSIKSFTDNTELLAGVTNGSFTISNAAATPTPTPPLSSLTITSPTLTYLATLNLTGTKDAATTTVYVNGSSTGVTYPTSTTWQVSEALTLGDNTFTVYGADGSGNQTATVSTTINRHTLGDINGDGLVDFTDASLFAVDWGKTSGLTYVLSDMNGDGSVDLTDLSILAKLIGQ